jgi:hypothetical protein
VRDGDIIFDDGESVLRFRKEEDLMATSLSGKVKIEVTIYLPQLEPHRRSNADRCLKALPGASDVAILAGACEGAYGWVTFTVPEKTSNYAAWIAEMREAVDRVLRLA